MGKKKFTAEVETIICSRYLAGENTVQLGDAFGVGGNTIGSILRRNGVKTRSLGEARRGLNPAAELEVCRRYLAGESAIQLENAFGVSKATILRILRRNSVKTRSLSESNGGLSAEVEAIVCSRYLGGENTVQLENAFGVDNTTICRILKRNSVKTRSLSEAQGGLSAEVEAIVCSRYLEGENTHQLGNVFGVTNKTIGNILKRNSVKTRSMSESHGGLNAEAEIIVCQRYLAGENTHQLGNVFGVNNNTIGKILKRHNVEARSSGVEFGDSVQHILDSTGRHTQPRECSFYLFELAGHSQTHCKPGIAFDVNHRVHKGGGQYGQEAVVQVFATRAEAWFLEQAVLDETRSNAMRPEELENWGGASEIRSMAAVDMEFIVFRLIDELEELGMWEFAAAYVPMTAAQRALCQQKSLLSLHAG